jgi:alcohol dehydrogenase class IV
MRFEFATAGRIVFGSGTSSEVPSIAQALGRRLLLITHRSFAALNPALTTPLKTAAAETFEIAGEPDFERVRLGTALGRNAKCDHVVAVGGGSTIDAAKAIAMLLSNGGDPLDYAEVVGAAQPIEKPPVPWIAVPTTSGAGAEATRNAVLRSPEHAVKVSLRSPFMLPTVAVVDPDLTRSLPPLVTSTTGLDALSQVLEPFVSRKANPLTDALCREGLMRIGRSLLRAVQDGHDSAAREDMSLGALLGGMALANGGLGAVHGFAAPIGGAFDAPHGAVCAALLAPVMEANLAAGTPSIRERYSEAARLLTGRNDASAEDGVTWVRTLTTNLSISGLATYGLAETHIPDLCEKALRASSMQGNPVPHPSTALAQILRAAL